MKKDGCDVGDLHLWGNIFKCLIMTDVVLFKISKINNFFFSKKL